MKISFIKAPKPRRYHHVNIYYNPEKEAHEERELRVKKESGEINPDEPYRVGISRGSFRRTRDREVQDNAGSSTRSARSMANIRFLVIAAILIAVAAVLYLSSGAYLAL